MAKRSKLKVRDDKLEITLRGEPTDLINALVNGLPRETLVALHDMLKAQLAKQSH